MRTRTWFYNAVRFKSISKLIGSGKKDTDHDIHLSNSFLSYHQESDAYSFGQPTEKKKLSW